MIFKFSLANIFLVLLSCLSCTSNSTIQEYEYQKINSSLSNLNFDYQFSDGKKVYLIEDVHGPIRFHDDSFNIYSATLFDTLNFKLDLPPFEGLFRGYCFTNEYLYIALDSIPESQNLNHSILKLFKISKHTNEVSQIYELDLPTAFLKNMKFINDEVGYLNIRIDSGPLLYKTINGGKSWEIKETDVRYGKSKFIQNDLYFLSRHKEFTYEKYNRINSINLESFKVAVTPLTIDIFDFQIQTDALYLFSKTDTTFHTIKYTDSHYDTLSTLHHSKEWYINELYLKENTIILLKGFMDKGLLGGFGGTEYKIIISNNLGKTWNHIPIRNSQYLKPLVAITDSLVICYFRNGDIFRIPIL